MTAETAVSPFAAAPVRALDIMGVKKAIPHRYPFLLIDKIEVIQEDKYCIGIKMVTANEQFFEGHFPGQPVMPGVLIVESMAQTACAMLLSKGGFENKIAFFRSEEHTSELQSHSEISYAVFCLKKKK